jgi:uncharacterized protein with PQ loop repeat
VVAELLGWFGAGLSCVISLPQVVRTVRAKQLDGISSATYWLVLANAAAWSAWSLLTGEYAAGLPALVNGPIAIVILHRLAVTRHDTFVTHLAELVGHSSAASPRDPLAPIQLWKRNVTNWNGLSSRSIDGPSLVAPSGTGRSSRSVASTEPTSAAAVTVARARPPSDS